jgi:Holliday junction resolvase RusA-like endonuclease
MVLVPYFVGEDDAAVTMLAPDHIHVEDVTFEVSGDPRPLQRSRWARFFNGVIPYNPSRRVINRFRDAAREVLFLFPGDNPVFDENTYLEVNCWFVLKRPRKHFCADGSLRVDAPKYPIQSDIDNLVKLVLDAMQGILYHDDRRIVVLFAGKAYKTENDPRIMVYLNENDLRTNAGKTIIKASVKH